MMLLYTIVMHLPIFAQWTTSCTQVPKCVQSMDSYVTQYYGVFADTRFLIRFLRVNSYSQLEARNMLEKYLKNVQEIPEWMQNMDPNDQKFQAILDSG